MESSIFDHVPVAPDDPILGLSQRFLKDARPNKVNLGVGAYKDEKGKSVVLRCVRKAEKRIIEKQLAKDYLPIRGLDSFREAVPRLVFGEDCSAIKEERVCNSPIRIDPSMKWGSLLNDPMTQ
jgi:aspartate/tyrosine/aromatic aminotransferase